MYGQKGHDGHKGHRGLPTHVSGLCTKQVVAMCGAGMAQYRLPNGHYMLGSACCLFESGIPTLYNTP